MKNIDHTVTAVSLPADCGVLHAYATTNLADAFSIALPAGATNNPETLARFIFTQSSPWVTGLMVMRDAIVRPFGLKTSDQLKLDETSKPDRVGIFRIYSADAKEIILGEDDSHLDFRLSVLHQAGPTAASSPHLVVSTVVHCHNLLGRTYIFLIAPFHRRIVRSMLRMASQTGWPKTAA